ncbi:MAG: SAM-dependent chlorinase/fluorinase [Bacteroidetes bacterium]|nr:SAM-dependent chlorinase/fluorinase [Bacteroidota bacterium]
MPVITITTDWGTKDYFVGAMKGDILTACPQATLVDITHDVKPFDLVQGAFIFKNSWSRFPKGTVHLIGMNSETKESLALVAVSYNDHYFIGPDDGFFTLVFDEIPEEKYFILDAKGNKVNPSSIVLASSAAFLANGGKIADMGMKAESLIQNLCFCLLLRRIRYADILFILILLEIW